MLHRSQHAEAADTSSPRHSTPDNPAIVDVDLRKQLAFPDGPSYIRAALIRAYSSLTGEPAEAAAAPAPGAGPDAAASTSTGAPGATLPPPPSDSVRISEEDERAAQQEAWRREEAAGAAEAAARRGRQGGPSGPARALKLARARRYGLCACGAAATTDAAEEESDAAEASHLTAESELARARRRFEALTAGAMAMPTIVVQPDAALCLCEVDRSSSDVADPGDDRQHRAVEPMSRSQQGTPGSGGRAAGAGAVQGPGGDATRSEGDQGSAGPAEPGARETDADAVAAGAGPHEYGAAQGSGDEGVQVPGFTDAGADAQPCLCYRIDLEVSDFQHVLR